MRGGVSVLAASLLVPPAAAAPVVVQKGSTAQYIYIPAASVASEAGASLNNAATAAKQFCKKFITKSGTVAIHQSLMLDPTVKVGATLIGGGSGSNNATHIYSGSTVVGYRYGSAGAGGASAVVLNGTVVAVAPGADAPTAVSGPGSYGVDATLVTAPEMTLSKTGPAPVLQIHIGGGGGPANIIFDANNRPYDLNSGYGGKGLNGGGGGARVVATSALSTFTAWPSPAQGGTATVGGAGAVAPALGTSRSNGSMGGPLAGGYGSNGPGTFSSTEGQVFYGQVSVGGYLQTRYEWVFPSYIEPYMYTYATEIFPVGSTAMPVRGSVVVTPGAAIDETSMTRFGKGSGAPTLTGVAGIVMLFYSHATCNLM